MYKYALSTKEVDVFVSRHKYKHTYIEYNAIDWNCTYLIVSSDIYCFLPERNKKRDTN